MFPDQIAERLVRESSRVEHFVRLEFLFSCAGPRILRGIEDGIEPVNLEEPDRLRERPPIGAMTRRSILPLTREC